MIGYTKRYVLTVSFFITIIIFYLCNSICNYINIVISKETSTTQKKWQEQYSNNLQEKTISKNNTIKAETNETKEKTEETNIEEIIDKSEIWQISIPTINLVAPISNGTTMEVMNKYVGHFENTSLWNGNVCLAAHNRGYEVNYFQNLKNLKIGDKIIYQTIEGTKKYNIEIITIINNTDWSYLENTLDNRITLITCLENEPNYRRCIQAIEIV